MRKNPLFSLFIVVFSAALLALLLATWPGPAAAQDPPQAALVVQFADRVETFCLDHTGEEMRGLDLLLAAGLDLGVDSGSSIGAGICRINDQGCETPAEDCFCQCMGGGPCAYWNYFYRESGQETWTYSPFGAAVHRVAPGSVEGWVWGDGQQPPPLDLTFEAICRPATAEPSATAQPTAPPLASPSPGAPAASSPVPTDQPTVLALAATATSPAGPTSTPAPTPPAEQGTGPASYLAFGALALILAAIGLFVLRRR